jgi:RNA polymerase sigma-70 factor (ECF subfamily)
MATGEELDKLFRDTAPLVYRTAYRVTCRPYLASDVVQTIFLRLMCGPLPKGIRENPKGYLYRAAVNESFRLWRWKKRQRTDPYAEDSEPLEAAAYDKQQLYEKTKDRLYDAIEQLEPEDKELLNMHYIQGHSDADIAKQLGVPRGTVASTLSRIRGKLREILKGESHE